MVCLVRRWRDARNDCTIATYSLNHDTLSSQGLAKWGETYGGSNSHLSEEKTFELVIYLTNNLLPTTQAIIEEVIDGWGIRYTVPGMTKWLNRNSFSYRQPVGILYKFSAEAQQIFMEIYNELKQKTGDDEPILFIDGVHQTQGTNLAYG